MEEHQELQRDIMLYSAVPFVRALDSTYPGYCQAELSSEWVIFLSIWWQEGEPRGIGTFYNSESEAIFRRTPYGTGEIVIPPGNKRAYLRGEVSVNEPQNAETRAETWTEGGKPDHVWRQGGKRADDNWALDEPLTHWRTGRPKVCGFYQYEVQQGG